MIFSHDNWDIESVTPPWGDRPSIYEHILNNIRPGEPGLEESGDLLPDDEIVSGDNQLRFAPGLFDAQIDHEVSSNEATETANKILESFRALTQSSTDERASSLYSLLLEHSTLPYIDHLLEISHDELDPERIRSIAHWLATGAADREPIKCAIALLGVYHGGDDRDLLLTLGRHEEFTLFASAALQNLGDDPELSIWALACLVTGWGRIQIIERLAETNDEQIKAWMLREGYRNQIGTEYTALICATTGELSTALLTPEPDDKLLKGAGSILTALITGRGGPSQGIEAYETGPEATELYLIHLQARDLDLQEFIDVSTIHEFLNEEDGESKDLTLGWLERSANLLGLTGAILSRPGWEQKVRDELNSDDRHTFWTASQAARMLGIDVWDVYFERLKRGEADSGLWFGALDTNDTDRIERVVAFAEETLPLNEIASGPSDSLGLGPEFHHHLALDVVLQTLRRFPGKGWPLIRAALQSPVIRNRYSAVLVLASWNQETWSEETAQLLSAAIQVEPNDDTRAAMLKAIEGSSEWL